MYLSHLASPTTSLKSESQTLLALDLILRRMNALLLVHNRGSTLLVHDVSNRPIELFIVISNLRLAEAIQFLRTHRVQVDRKRKRNEEPDQRHAHGDVVPLMVRHQARERGEQRAAGHRGHDPGGAALGVAAQPADCEREDGGEDAGLEEEDESERGDAGLALGAHGGRDEDHHPGHEDHEDPARLDDHHPARGDEAADGEQPLRDRVPVGARRVGDLGALDRVLDELRRDADLRAHVAELRGHAEEQLVLLAHRLVDVACQAGALFGLQGHVRVRDFGDRGEEEDNGEEEDEDGDAEVGPLDFGEVFGVGVVEEDAGGQKGGHYGANGC